MSHKYVKLHTLEHRHAPDFVTFGVPYKKGEVTDNHVAVCIGDDGNSHPIQSYTTAYWPDGSVKWAGYCVDARGVEKDITLEVSQEQSTEVHTKQAETWITERGDAYFVDTGILQIQVPKSGEELLRHGVYQGMEQLIDAKLIYFNETHSQDGFLGTKMTTQAVGQITKTQIERIGAVECVIRVEGRHVGEAFAGIPFIVRFTFHKNSKRINVTHTFFYDGDKNTQFMKGIGLQVHFANAGEGYNRHIKIAGDCGIFHEAMVGLKSFHPKIAEHFYKEQYEGQMIDAAVEGGDKIIEAIGNIPFWDSYSIAQLSPNSYEIRKSMAKKGCCSIWAGFGKRAKGLVYAGNKQGGISVAMRDFWQKFPSSLWIEGMRQDVGTMTAWFWSPESAACDFRHYDDEGHADGTYEGFNEVKNDPVGIANTNELAIEVYGAGIVDDDTLLDAADAVSKPALFVAAPEYYHETKAFGEWALIDRSTPLKKWLEDELDRAVDFYIKEVDLRNWYGLFNYGDVMHTYDRYRHMWMYDMGGRAWQNTELAPTLWLWYAFMRSGREDIFTMIEAMSRHASEVDMYHFGIYKGIGSRHNVIHWGDSCKEPRIGMAAHHRPFYYLRGGELRMGDVLTDTKDADYATLNIDPLRHFYKKEEMVYPTHARSGPDWTAFVSNWMTQWERTQDTFYKDKIETGLADIFATPLGFVSGPEFEYDPHTGHLRYLEHDENCISHMSVSMGGPQVMIELSESLDNPQLKEQLAIYGSYYFLPLEEKQKKANGYYGSVNCVYPYMGATMAAYAAHYYKDEHLAYQVWQVLVHSLAGKDKSEGFDSNQVERTFNYEDLTEMFWISTNFTAQWCLNTIVALELTKDMMPETKEEITWEDWVK